jgi:hypothetical protein
MGSLQAVQLRFGQSPSANEVGGLAGQHGNGNGDCHYGNGQQHTCRGQALVQMFSDEGFEHWRTQIRNRYRLGSIDHAVSPFQLPSEHFLLVLPRREWGGTLPNRFAGWGCLITLSQVAIEWKRRFIRSSRPRTRVRSSENAVNYVGCSRKKG